MHGGTWKVAACAAFTSPARVAVVVNHLDGTPLGHPATIPVRPQVDVGCGAERR